MVLVLVVTYHLRPVGAWCMLPLAQCSMSACWGGLAMVISTDAWSSLCVHKWTGTSWPICLHVAVIGECRVHVGLRDEQICAVRLQVLLALSVCMRVEIHVGTS